MNKKSWTLVNIITKVRRVSNETLGQIYFNGKKIIIEKKIFNHYSLYIKTNLRMYGLIDLETTEPIGIQLCNCIT